MSWCWQNARQCVQLMWASQMLGHVWRIQGQHLPMALISYYDHPSYRSQIRFSNSAWRHHHQSVSKSPQSSFVRIIIIMHWKGWKHGEIPSPTISIRYHTLPHRHHTVKERTEFKFRYFTSNERFLKMHLRNVCFFFTFKPCPRPSAAQTSSGWCWLFFFKKYLLLEIFFKQAKAT